MNALHPDRLRALAVLPTDLKPRIREMPSGYLQLTAPPWNWLQGWNLYYVSFDPQKLLQMWVVDVLERHKDRTFEELVYRARREFRIMRRALGQIGRY
jgi:hypothetical protein